MSHMERGLTVVKTAHSVHEKTLRIQFGERVKELRIATGMSQEALLIGVGLLVVI